MLAYAQMKWWLISNDLNLGLPPNFHIIIIIYNIEIISDGVLKKRDSLV